MFFKSHHCSTAANSMVLAHLTGKPCYNDCNRNICGAIDTLREYGPCLEYMIAILSFQKLSSQNLFRCRIEMLRIEPGRIQHPTCTKLSYAVPLTLQDHFPNVPKPWSQDEDVGFTSGISQGMGCRWTTTVQSAAFATEIWHVTLSLNLKGLAIRRLNNRVSPSRLEPRTLIWCRTIAPC